MELSEIIEQAVAEAVAAQQAEAPPPTIAKPALASISPEPEIVSNEAQSTNASLDKLETSQQARLYTEPDETTKLDPSMFSGRTHTTNLLGSAEMRELSRLANVEEIDNAVVVTASVESDGIEDRDPQQQAPVDDKLVPFKALARRSQIYTSSNAVSDIPSYNPLDFYADVRFIPIMASRGVFQILQSNPALRDPSIHQSYTLISHGALSHTWSLLSLSESYARTSTVFRPIGILRTLGSGIPLADAIINDYSYAWRAQSVCMRHYSDSWGLSGSHAAFQVCKDYLFEWKPIEFPIGSGVSELYLWRHNIEAGTISPAARICAHSPIKSPIDNSELWSIEIDVDKLAPHIALLTAFSIQSPHSRLHSWFAPKVMDVPLPMPIVNFAFQDEGYVYQRLEKFYGDWEDSRIRHGETTSQFSPAETDNLSSTESTAEITCVQVFQREYIEQFSLPSEVIELLNTEARNYLEAVKAQYGLH